MFLKKALLISLLISILTSCSSTDKKSPQLSEHEKKSMIYYTHGTQMLIDKEYTEALSSLKEAVKLNPKNDQALNNLGMAYFFKKRSDLAIKTINQALAVNPKNSDARNNLASLYYKNGEIQKAKKEYETILGDLTYTNQHRTHYNIGLIYESEGKNDLAIKHLTKAADMKVDYCAANFKVSKIYKKQYKFHDSLNWAKKATLGACADNATPHLLEASLYIELKLFHKARVKIREVQDQFDNGAVLAQIHLLQNKIKKEEVFSKQEKDIFMQKYYKTNNPRKYRNSNGIETYESPSF